VSSDYTPAWNEAYRKHQNALFWPNEHLVRFVATRLRQRLTLDTFKDVAVLPSDPKVLDLGCGMGRHLVYLTEMRFAAYGIDLSDFAVAHASEWMRRIGVDDLRAITGSASMLPWDDGTFDAAVSHAVLDSMPFVVAEAAVRELRRVVKPGGWVYVDLIASTNGVALEEVVTGSHETGTVQSYFDTAKIDRLLSVFEVDELYLSTTNAVRGARQSARWHVICR
jgi:ubiquinone/menaquinone biosynthesis C-methylase UbiE